MFNCRKTKKTKRRKINYTNKYSEQTVNLVKKNIKLNPKKNINLPVKVFNTFCEVNLLPQLGALHANFNISLIFKSYV